jgi:hypothetical protein
MVPEPAMFSHLDSCLESHLAPHTRRVAATIASTLTHDDTDAEVIIPAQSALCPTS